MVLCFVPLSGVGGKRGWDETRGKALVSFINGMQ